MTHAISLILIIGLLAVIILTTGTGTILTSLGMGIVLFASLLYLAYKAESGRRQTADVTQLRTAYDQLDQQAKLVIRTDVELHRAQEELDRRLASLMSLHQLGRQLQVSLHPDEVLRKLDASIVTNFGFTTGLLGLCQSLGSLEWHSLIGVNPDVAERVRRHLVDSQLLKGMLTKPLPTILDRATASLPAHRQLLDLLEVSSVVMAGIMPHSGPASCLLLGRSRRGAVNIQADEELVAILTNQLAIAVENSALYETAWSAQQDLQRKVQERTRELAEANAALIRLNQAKSDFVSAVSHELRTPLAAIKGYAALLGSGQFGSLTTPQQERIGKIEKHSDLLTQLITNLLDIARIESGRVTMEHRAIPVEEFFAGVYDMVHPQLQAKQLHYTAAYDAVKEFMGDPQQLQRVFVNLLSNAIKYTPEHGTITLRVSHEATGLTIGVSDTGYGIGPDDLPKLFQEFYRANDPINQQVRGTGLGLALVKRIVEAHRGRITVTSAKGQGSTFTVTLPQTP